MSKCCGNCRWLMKSLEIMWLNKGKCIRKNNAFCDYIDGACSYYERKQELLKQCESIK
jgi:hypothetical protein